jgi:hypothetical protein
MTAGEGYLAEQQRHAFSAITVYDGGSRRRP